MKTYANLSYMMIRGWFSRYSEIIREFGFSKRQDQEAAYMLNSIIKNPVPIKKIQSILKGKTVFVIGSGPSLGSSISMLKKYKKNPKIVADSALKILVQNKIFPDIVVTDLDGDERSLKIVGNTKSVMIVHAHGDNIARLHLAENFKNCIGTTQGKTLGNLFNFGGFTDGDRAVFLANAFDAKKIILFGMDLENKIGKFSKTKILDKKIKRKKLHKAKMLLQWLSTKSRCELFTTSKPIPGFKKIQYKDLKDIIIT